MLKEAALAIALLYPPIHAEPLKPPPMRWLYDWKVIEVVDGDTIKVEAKWLPSPLKPEILIRIAGVDTPELGWKGHCQEEKDLAEKAKKFSEKFIREATDVRIEVVGFDKYGGRLLGDIWIDHKQLSRELVYAGLAQYYFGEKKPEWCNQGESK